MESRSAVLVKLWNLEVQFWVNTENLGNKEKSNMKVGQNLDPRIK